jgi:hypothetical protein
VKKLVTAAALTALALGIAGCGKETPAEKQVEAQADAIGDAYKADADVQRSLAEGAPDEKAQDKAADQTEKKGEAIEDKLKKEADEMGDDTLKRQDAAKQ